MPQVTVPLIEAASREESPDNPANVERGPPRGGVPGECSLEPSREGTDRRGANPGARDGHLAGLGPQLAACRPKVGRSARVEAGPEPARGDLHRQAGRGAEGQVGGQRRLDLRLELGATASALEVERGAPPTGEADVHEEPRPVGPAIDGGVGVEGADVDGAGPGGVEHHLDSPQVQGRQRAAAASSGGERPARSPLPGSTKLGSARPRLDSHSVEGDRPGLDPTPEEGGEARPDDDALHPEEVRGSRPRRRDGDRSDLGAQQPIHPRLPDLDRAEAISEEALRPVTNALAARRRVGDEVRGGPGGREQGYPDRCGRAAPGWLGSRRGGRLWDRRGHLGEGGRAPLALSPARVNVSWA